MSRKQRPFSDTALDEGRIKQKHTLLSARAAVASNLKRIAATIADAPEIDEQKVAAAKRALARGTYRIDPDRIADKLISLDTALRHGFKKAPE